MAHSKPEQEKSLKAANIFGQPLSIFGVPVDREAIFTNHKGAYHKKIEKRQRRLIVKSTFLKFFLQHNEQIRCLTTCYSPVSIMEQIATGPFFLFFKRALLVFTNHRILHVPTRFDRQPRAAVSQILYEDCARLTLKGRALQVQYKNGSQEVFPYLGRKERKKIRALIAGLTLSPKDAGRLKGRAHLCPSCTHILPAHAKLCDACKMSFKTVFKAKLRSFLTPGGGYFYARYPAVGSIMATLEIALITALIYQCVRWRSGMPAPIALLAIFALGLILIKTITAFHSSLLVQEYVPEDKDFTIRKM